MKLEVIDSTPDTEIVSARNIPVPRELVYKAWTDPEHLKNWWGPKGFTNTFHEYYLRPKGRWRFIMHGPDNTNYLNECVFVQIKEPSLIIWNHISYPEFQVVVTFERLSDNETLLIFKMVFNSIEECNHVKTYAVDKNEENFDKLEAELSAMRMKLTST